MQINQNEIQRPTLITPFFGKELTPDNEYLSYVDTSSDCISVTPTSNNSKNQLSFEESMNIDELNKRVQSSPKAVIKSILEDIFDCECLKSLNKNQLFSKYLIQTCRFFELNSDDLDACENLKRDIYKNVL